MPSAADIRAGGAFTELYTKNGPLYAGLKAAESRIKAFSAGAKQIGQSMARFTAVVASPFVIGIKAASDMQETMSKFDVVFGENSKAMKKWGDEYGAQVGRSKQQIADFLAGNQDLFVPMGFDAASATEISKTLTTLAVDLGSFNNKADADVMNDLQAAMTGSGEVMKKYGVILSEAAVKAELLNQGLDPKGVTEAQKAQARLAIILRGTTAAQGDAIRTSGGFANQMKALKASAWDAAGAIGEALLPTVTGALTKVVGIAKAAAVWGSQNEGLVRTLAAIVSIVGVAGAGLWAFGAAAGGAATAMGVLTTAMTFMMAHPAVLAIAALTAGVLALGYALDKSQTGFLKLATFQQGAIEKGDKLRATDKALMDELQNLAAKTNLTNEEMERADQITGDLEGRYGDLGFSLDRTSGQITGVATAFDALTAAMQRNAESEIRAAMLEAGDNIQTLNEEVARVQKAWMTPWGKSAAIGEIERDREQELNRLESLFSRLKALKGGDMSALTGSSASPATTVPIAALPAEDALAMNERILDQIAEMRIERIEDEQQRAEAAINSRYDAEIEKAKELGADLALVEQARAAALGNVQADAQRRKDEEAAQAAKMKQLSNQQLQDEIAALKIQQSTTNEFDKQKALLELQRSQALRDAGDTGQDPALINELFDLKIAALKNATQGLKDAREMFAESGAIGSDAAYKISMGSPPFANLKAAVAQQSLPKKWPFDDKSKPTPTVAGATSSERDLVKLTQTLVTTAERIAKNTARPTIIKEAVPPKR